MRRDGDVLVEHVAGARRSVVICAPFIKAKVLTAILSRLGASVDVVIATRWIPEEVAAGVSDLEVYDIVADRPNTSLRLIDNLHAKIYIADEKALTGSANVTARALGWCSSPNLEVLVPVPMSEPAIQACMAAIEQAREATDVERAAVLEAAASADGKLLPEAADVDVLTTDVWLPRLGAPSRLFLAYLPAGRGRLTTDSLEAADYDLAALGLPRGLDEASFKSAVRDAMAQMPGVARLLQAADGYLDDTQGEELVRLVNPSADLKPSAQWSIFREWVTYFFSDSYEVAPQTFVVRPRSTKQPPDRD